MKIFHINCSVRRDHSVSGELSTFFTDRLQQGMDKCSVDYLNLKDDPTMPITSLFIQSSALPAEQRNQTMMDRLEESDELIDRLHEADIYVIGMPMHVFSVPTNFKNLLDSVVRIDKTFRLTDNGYEGMLKDKEVYVVNTRDYDFSDSSIEKMDHLVPYLRTVFAFMGIDNIHFINVFPIRNAVPEVIASAVKQAQDKIIYYTDALIGRRLSTLG